jgi:hypothetical protein
VLRVAVFEALFSRDPQGALARYEALPANVREAMQSSVASIYGRSDPDGALAWIQSLDEPDSVAARLLLSAVERSDPARALEIALDSQSRDLRSTATMIGMSLVSSGDRETIARVLDRLAGSAASTQVWSLWSSDDPQAALEWLKAHPPTGGDLSVVMRPLAEAFAARDADEAIRMTDTLPQSLRGAWQAEVNAVRAKSDPTALAGLLADARAEPALSSTVQAVMTAALANPAMALAQLEGADEVTRTRVLSTALREWTSTDPVAAAKWAAGVSDPALRGPAVRTTARLWGLGDFAAARRWALGLTDVADRDTALDGLLTPAARENALDYALVAAFSSPRAFQDALVKALPSIGRTDPEQGRALLERYVTDPEQRRSVELETERARTLSPTGLRPTPLPLPAPQSTR